ncbi:MAG: DUF1566 domain-containing protein [Patescibacteria group bacterium]|nr:DUF1566 domain-containing protein [Patescibacteria group bacterium]MDD4303993.1 DUF1566 domain-containing protein [Patescibacteria group bacterium]MDD4695018.1 DUF1566 domain-containing protein [Patescibacteria group bacterium]
MKKIISNGLKTKQILKNISFAVLVMLITFSITKAGDLFPAGTSVSSTFYTLGDIYTKLTDNTSSADEGDHDLTSSATPASTFHTLKEIYEAIPDIDSSKILYGTRYMGVGGTAYPSQPLKTGQTKCYDPSSATGDEIPCSGTGQDGEYQIGQAMSYTTTTNTVLDNSTGLMWKKCSEGLSGNNCETGTATTHTFAQAITICENDETDGYTDWRLPNIKELLTLVDFGKSNPAIDITAFPATVSEYYWSSTTYLDSPRIAWSVYFYDGGTGNGGKGNEGYVRCTR